MNEVANTGSNALSELHKLGLETPKATAEMQEMAFAGFNPNLRLFPASGKIVAGKPHLPGNWGLFNGDEFKVLTNQILVVPLTFRTKAVDWREKQTVIAFGSDDPEYLSIKEYCEDFKEKNKGSMGCEAMYGIEFLMLYAGAEKFTLIQFYLNNPTMRGQSENLAEFIRKPTILKSKLITAKSNTWYGFEVSLGSADDLPPLPPLSKLKPAVDKFLNPPKDEEANVETVSR
jgi:hypothetical protein